MHVVTAENHFKSSCMCKMVLQDGTTVLHLAACSDSEGKEKIAFLLEKGVGINVRDHVSRQSDCKLVKSL